MRHWSTKRTLAAGILFVVVALVLREFAGWAAEAFRAMHGGGASH